MRCRKLKHKNAQKKRTLDAKLYMKMFQNIMHLIVGADVASHDSARRLEEIVLQKTTTAEQMQHMAAAYNFE